MELIVSPYAPTEHDLQDERFACALLLGPSFLELNQEASDLYGLIHARFILSARGTPIPSPILIFP